MTLYLFGSAAFNKATRTSDVDLLLVYRDGQHDRAHSVACTIRAIPADPHWEVLAMSDSEVLETNFVISERAVSLGAGEAVF